MDLEAILPLKRIIKVEQCNIGIIHGHNYGGPLFQSRLSHGQEICSQSCLMPEG